MLKVIELFNWIGSDFSLLSLAVIFWYVLGYNGVVIIWSLKMIYYTFHIFLAYISIVFMNVFFQIYKGFKSCIFYILSLKNINEPS